MITNIFQNSEERYRNFVKQWCDSHPNRGLFFNQKDESEAEIEVFDVIGEGFFGGISESQFSNELKKAKDSKVLTVKINSPGGFVDAGLTMFNLLSEFEGKVITKNMGMAASAAAFLMQGGDERISFNNGMLMVHKALAFMLGNADDLREEADILDKLDNNLIKLFVNRTGLDEKKVRQLLKDETFMDAEEAQELGFIDTVIESKKKEDAKNFIKKFQASAQKPDKSTPTVKEVRWQDANANTHLLPEGSGHLDFNLRINNQIYPITKKRFIMLQQFVDESDFDSPEKALEQFKALKKNAKDQSTDLVELKTEVGTLTKTLAAKDSVMESIQRKQSIIELNDRIKRIEALVDSKRIEPADAKPLHEAYTEIDPATVGDTQRDADHDLKFYESLKPREDLLELEGLTGSDGEGKDNKKVSAEQQLVDIAKAKQTEKPEMSWGDAFRLAKEENPELIK